MTQLFASASKLVFLVLAVTGCVAFLWGKLEAKDFMMMIGMAFSFYFGKSMPGGNDISPANPPLVERTTTVQETVTPAPPEPPKEP